MDTRLPAVPCMQYWSACSLLEGLSLAGQAWFAGFCAFSLLSGTWTGSAALGTALGIVFISHFNSLVGLLALGWAMTGPQAQAAGFQQTTARRLRSIGRSRALLQLSVACFAAAVAVMAVSGTRTEPRWVFWISAAAVIFPWFSLHPRWKLEEPLLEAASSERREP